MKIRPVGAELFHADKGTDGRTKLIVTFRNFANSSPTGRILIQFDI
jgi:hypothetical protein